MISYGDTIYYIDLKALEKSISSDSTLLAQTVTDVDYIENFDMFGALSSTQKITKTYNKGREIDGSKYATITLLLETVIDYIDTEDTSLGSHRALNKTPLSFKLAFNTLLKEGIIKAKK